MNKNSRSGFNARPIINKLFCLISLFCAIIILTPFAHAIDVGADMDLDVEVENFSPLVWMCGHREVYDDNIEWGRFVEPAPDRDVLLERVNNYAFEGEAVRIYVLVMDKNGVPEKIRDVYATLGTTQGAGNDIEVNCVFRDDIDVIVESCNAEIDEEELEEFDPEIMAYYECIFTVETPLSMYGEYWLTVEAEDIDGLLGTIDENEYWFFNPVIAISIDGTLSFEDVRPGTDSYSDTLLISNDADDGSGVMLDMFISGTDFYDSANSGAMCPTTNQIALSSFRYFATNGAFSTYDDMEVDVNTYDPVTIRDSDAEGYVNIQYGDHFDRTMYDEAEILQQDYIAPYYVANILAPGADMALTFKLSLPEPCNGDFDTGSLYFWGEAI
ncbi:MAG: hypothetical protein V1659_02495 [Candidatus Woesearchaeota archaeon]